MHLDVSFPGGDLRRAAELARQWEAIGISHLWSSKTQHNPFLSLAAATVTTERIGLGTWSDIGSRVGERYADLLDRVSLRGAEGLTPGDSRWAQILTGVAA